MEAHDPHYHRSEYFLLEYVSVNWNQEQKVKTELTFYNFPGAKDEEMSGKATKPVAASVVNQ